jgi:hypothetical protein
LGIVLEQFWRIAQRTTALVLGVFDKAAIK